jgi:hypothetical protein
MFNVQYDEKPIESLNMLGWFFFSELFNLNIPLSEIKDDYLLMKDGHPIQEHIQAITPQFSEMINGKKWTLHYTLFFFLQHSSLYKMLNYGYIFLDNIEVIGIIVHRIVQKTEIKFRHETEHLIPDKRYRQPNADEFQMVYDLTKIE